MSELEAKAKEQGWAPKEEWRGDPDKWVDAQEFVERGETILPIVNAQLKKEREANQKLREDIDEVKKTAAEFQAFQKRQAEQAIKAVEARMEALKAQRAEAISQGDGERVNAIDDEIEEARETKRQAKVEPQNEDMAYFDTWLKDNNWYQEDAKMRRYADGVAAELNKDGVKGKTFLKQLRAEVESQFPDKFKNPNRERSDVDTGTTRPPSGGKTYNDLPDEAKKACDRFVKTIPGYTKEAYLADYFGVEA